MTVEDLPAYFASEARFYAACDRLAEYCRTAKARQYRRNRAAQIRRREGAGA
jgi:hypothetical protein